MKYERQNDIVHARAKLLASLGRVRGQTGGDFLFRAVRSNAKNHYLAFSLDDPRRISYAPPPRHKYDHERRVKTTLARYIRRQFGWKWTDRLLEQLVDGVFQADEIRDCFSTVYGEAIRDAYRKAIGGVSCMTHPYTLSYLELYVKNPDKVGLLIYRDSKMEARALLWCCDDGSVCVDRIYPNSGYHIAIFESYSASNGFLMRDHQRLAERERIEFGGQERSVTLQARYKYLPYLDSFFATNTNPHHYDTVQLTSNGCGAYILQGCEGHVLCNECAQCGYCLDDTDIYSHNGDDWCADCHYDVYSLCDSCMGWFYHDEITEVDGEPMCPLCVENFATCCEGCGGYTRDPVAVYVNKHRVEAFCEACAGDVLFECRCGALHSPDAEYLECGTCGRELEREGANV